MRTICYNSGTYSEQAFEEAYVLYEYDILGQSSGEVGHLFF